MAKITIIKTDLCKVKDWLENIIVGIEGTTNFRVMKTEKIVGIPNKKTFLK